MYVLFYIDADGSNKSEQVSFGSFALRATKYEKKKFILYFV